VRDQCKAAGVPFLFKQWGEWSPDVAPAGMPCGAVAADGWWSPNTECWYGRDHSNTAFVWRVGKHAAGRLLDGVEHNEFPKQEALRDFITVWEEAKP